MFDIFGNVISLSRDCSETITLSIKSKTRKEQTGPRVDNKKAKNPPEVNIVSHVWIKNSPDTCVISKVKTPYHQLSYLRLQYDTPTLRD